MKKNIYIALSFLTGFVFCWVLVALHPSGRTLEQGEYLISPGGYVFYADANKGSESAACIFGRNLTVFYQGDGVREQAMIVNKGNDTLLLNGCNIDGTGGFTSLAKGEHLLLTRDAGIQPDVWVNQAQGGVVDVFPVKVEGEKQSSGDALKRVDEAFSRMYQMTHDKNLAPLLKKYGYAAD